MQYMGSQLQHLQKRTGWFEDKKRTLKEQHVCVINKYM